MPQGSECFVLNLKQRSSTEAVEKSYKKRGIVKKNLKCEAIWVKVTEDPVLKLALEGALQVAATSWLHHHMFCTLGINDIPKEAVDTGRNHLFGVRD